MWMRVEDGLELNSPVAKFLSDEEKSALVVATEAEVGDLLFIVADERPMVRHVLGLLRLAGYGRSGPPFGTSAAISRRYPTAGHFRRRPK